MILFCGYQIADYFLQRRASDEKYAEVSKKVDEFRGTAENDVKAAEGKKDGAKPAPKPVDYKGLMEMLWAENKDVVAYLDVQGTETHYPVVQGDDNAYYLWRGVDGIENLQGTPFMDYMNNPSLADRNTVIYAHMMFNGDAMFGSLKHFLDEDYVKGRLGTFTLTNENGVHYYRVFAALKIPADEDYRTPNPPDDQWVSFLNDLYDRSWVKFMDRPKFDLSTRIVTLSTCTPEQNAALRIAVFGIYEKTGNAVSK